MPSASSIASSSSGLFDRLQQVRSNAQLAAFRNIFRTVSRGQHHDHGAAERRFLFDLFGKK